MPRAQATVTRVRFSQRDAGAIRATSVALRSARCGLPARAGLRLRSAANPVNLRVRPAPEPEGRSPKSQAFAARSSARACDFTEASNRKTLDADFLLHPQEQRKAKHLLAFSIAGAGFEPATFGL